MELVEGRDLSDMIALRDPLALERKLDIAIEVLTGLHFAHQRGVIHRDVKPSNVRVMSDGRVKIMDFGIARLQKADATGSGAIVGTPTYMAPEQITNGAITPATDVFSVGCMLYELLCYQRPFEAESVHGVLYQVLTTEPRPLRTVAPSIPAAPHRPPPSPPYPRRPPCLVGRQLPAGFGSGGARARFHRGRAEEQRPGAHFGAVGVRGRRSGAAAGRSVARAPRLRRGGAAVRPRARRGPRHGPRGAAHDRARDTGGAGHSHGTRRLQCRRAPGSRRIAAARAGLHPRQGPRAGGRADRHRRGHPPARP